MQSKSTQQLKTAVCYGGCGSDSRYIDDRTGSRRRLRRGEKANAFAAGLAGWFLPAVLVATGSVGLAAAKSRAIGLPQFRLVKGGSPIPEPYPKVHGGSFSGPKVKWSPDPLVAYRWPHPRAADGLQTYVLRPVAVHTRTPGVFSGLKSATSGHCGV